MLDPIYAHVAKGEKVVLTGFGIFEKRDRAARMARNPATGASVRVKKTSVPAFRPGAEFKAITSGAKKVAKSAAAKKAAPAAGRLRRKKAASKAPARNRRQGSGKAAGHQGSGQEGSGARRLRPRGQPAKRAR